MTHNTTKGMAAIATLQWLLGGAGTFIAAIALAYTGSTTANVSALYEKVGINTASIGQLHTSTCIQNENIRNLAIALKTSFVSDPNCQNN